MLLLLLRRFFAFQVKGRRRRGLYCTDRISFVFLTDWGVGGGKKLLFLSQRATEEFNWKREGGSLSLSWSLSAFLRFCTPDCKTNKWEDRERRKQQLGQLGFLSLSLLILSFRIKHKSGDAFVTRCSSGTLPTYHNTIERKERGFRLT